MSNIISLVYGFILLVAINLFTLFVGPSAIWPITISDLPFLILLGGYIILCVLLLRKSQKSLRSIVNYRLLMEGLFCLTLLLFLFSYVYARNANMDYAQRFAQFGSQLRLAPTSTRERIIVLTRFVPLLLASGGWYVVTLFQDRHTGIIDRLGLLFVLLAVVLTMLSLPSWLHLDGMPFFAWISLVPLFIVLPRIGYWRGIFLGTAYGAYVTLCNNYWLGTFSLISLQVATIILAIYYLLFLLPAVWIIRKIPSPLLLALLWSVFGAFKHLGFASFPWGLPVHSQYRFTALIQMAEITGIWGIDFIIIYANAAIAHVLYQLSQPVRPGWKLLQHSAAASILLILALIFGIVRLQPVEGDTKSLRTALIQNNNDPRKTDYEETFQVLKTLTTEANEYSPDIIIWPETAFVPNIRRWSQESAEQSPLVDLVRRFLRYQSSLDTWLLTGNDDYEVIRDATGKELSRNNYNAAVLFSPSGKRVDTYRKIHLVPFTETFPYKQQLPGLYNFLLSFDVHFWEKGERWVVFEHPRMRFSVLICFEDSFPADVRQFVLQGSELLVNISNDYWAQDEVEAVQHFATSLFRTVEHRRPMVRSTISGLTSYIDAYGRIRKSLPQYQEGLLIVDVQTASEASMTLYTRWGDWFPIASLILSTAFIGLYFFRLIRLRRKS